VPQRHLGPNPHRGPRRSPHPLGAPRPAIGRGGGLLVGESIPRGEATRIRRSQKVDGVKPHVLLDSSGALVAVVLTPADVQDRPAFPKLLRKAKPIAPSISHVWVDKGYTGQTVAGGAARAGVIVDVVSGPKPGRGFIVQPSRRGG
jgi:hypothetical protein